MASVTLTFEAFEHVQRVLDDGMFAWKLYLLPYFTLVVVMVS
jgi:hypothetical protein